MALYVGSDRQKIVLNDVVYCLNLFSEIPIINEIKLLSADNYILADVNGIYLTTKESE